MSDPRFKRFKLFQVIVGAAFCGVVQVVTAPLNGHPLLSWRLGVAVVLGGIGGLVVGSVAVRRMRRARQV